MKARRIRYGVVLRFGSDRVLTTADGAVIIGSKEDMGRVFGGLLTDYVPIDTANTSIALKEIRQHVPDMFKKLVDENA